MTKMKNKPEGINNRLDIVEQEISNMENRIVEIIQ